MSLKSNGRISGSAKHAEELLAFESFVDEAIEQSLRRHLGIKATLDSLLPAVAHYLGAMAVTVRTCNEELAEETFSWGRGHKHALWISRPLDIAGKNVGSAAFAFPAKTDAKNRSDFVRIFCEEIDAILWNIQTAEIKQSLIDRVTRALTHPLFHDGISAAITVLREAIPFEQLVVLHVDEAALETRTLHYKVFKSSSSSRRVRCTHSSDGRPLKALVEAIRADGIALLSPDRHGVARALDLPYAVETLFIIGITQTEYLGQLVISTPSGLDSLGRDLLRVFANAVSQRLIDYRRERRHLNHYFSQETINALLRNKNYREKFLAPRQAEIGILYADLNSFTKLCETMKDPEKIGKFIHAWSDEAVRIIWKHGGVFDKMVGDCVIAHFGPPFFRKKRADNAQAAVRVARELQAFTIALGKRKENNALVRKAKLPGFGVAVGIHLCKAAIGLFGPNQDYTAFSSGMNQTARLQSVAGFREILIMDAARKVLPSEKGLLFDGPKSIKVKNITRPLRYFKLQESPPRRS